MNFYMYFDLILRGNRTNVFQLRDGRVNHFSNARWIWCDEHI